MHIGRVEPFSDGGILDHLEESNLDLDWNVWNGIRLFDLVEKNEQEACHHNKIEGSVIVAILEVSIKVIDDFLACLRNDYQRAFVY